MMQNPVPDRGLMNISRLRIGYGKVYITAMRISTVYKVDM